MDFEEVERIKKENEKLKAIVECVDKLKQFNEDIENYALVDYKEADKIVCENIQLKQQLAEKECEADQRYKDWQEEIRQWCKEQIAMGRRVVPCGDCDNFDYQKGCRGHLIEEDEQLTHQHEDKGE